MIPTYTKLFLAHFSARLQGVDPADPQSFAMAKGLAESPQTQLAGLYTHGGHSYDAQVGP
jgi:D-serine deaminase-like pyridoxal phosphate-dependent protein